MSDLKLVSLLTVLVCLCGTAIYAEEQDQPQSNGRAAGVTGWHILSGDGKATGNPPGFAQDGKSALVVGFPDPGADDYLVEGEALLGAAPASLRVAIGGPNEKGEKGGPAAVQILVAKTGKLSWNRQAIEDETLKVAQTWLRFSACLVHGRVVFDLHVSGAKQVSDEARPGRQSISLTLRGCAVRNLQLQRFPRMPKQFVPVVIDRIANTTLAGPDMQLGGGLSIETESLPAGVQEIDGVPFYFSRAPEGRAIDLSPAWAGQTSNVPRATGTDGHQPQHGQLAANPTGAGTTSTAQKTPLPASKKPAPPAAPKGKKKKANSPASGGRELEVQGVQYSAIHLIAFAHRRPETTPQVAVRLGYNQRGADIGWQQLADVPYLDEPAPGKAAAPLPVKLADGRMGHLYHLRVPLPGGGNLMEFPALQLSFGRELRVSDEGFLEKVIGRPSGAVILAATLERSPVPMKYRAAELCNVFYETQKVLFHVDLTNVGGDPQAGRVYAECAGPGTAGEQNPARRVWTVEHPFQLKADESGKYTLDLAPRSRGWYSCRLAVECGGKIVQYRDTSFAVLAPDERKALADSPFGIWCFWSSHASSRDPQRYEKLISLFPKGGWRWTYGGLPGEAQDQDAHPNFFQELKLRYKLTLDMQGPPHSHGWSGRNSPPEQKGTYYNAETFRQDVVPWLDRARARGYDPCYKVLHEARTSKTVLRNFSEFLGGTPYAMPADEAAKLERQFQSTIAFCRAIKEHDPHAGVLLINDYPAFAAEYLKRKFPPELFDVIGLESAMFHRQPERQPDLQCLLGTLQQIKRMQEAYGYHKPVWFTEALYHSSKPGTLSIREQAVIVVREAMLALANGVERMAAANTLVDCSDDYSRSGWGTAGMCFRDPEYNPKPSFAMYAWMTQVLDQAHFAGKVPHDSTVLHLLDFRKSTGVHVYPLWVVRGRQRVTLKLSGDSAEVWDAYGNRLPVRAERGQLTVEATDVPCYVTGADVTAVTAREPMEEQSAVQEGQPLGNLQDAKHIQILDVASPLLETTGMPVNIRGKYALSWVGDAGATAMKVELLDDKDPRMLFPRYAELKFAEPIGLPGPHPFAVDLRVKGNGGWGRLMLEVVDANGQTWTSYRDGEAECLGRPYVNFDGWHTVRIYLPGKHFGQENGKPWPASADWVHSGESPLVAYPLKLTKIIIAMRPHILYVNEERPVTNRAILIERLSAVQAPAGM